MSADRSIRTTISKHFAPGERAEMERAIEAVCEELGLGSGEQARRKAVEERVVAAFRHGRRQPLYLVDAGLGA
jgi:hypothetical protein